MVGVVKKEIMWVDYKYILEEMQLSFVYKLDVWGEEKR